MEQRQLSNKLFPTTKDTLVFDLIKEEVDLLDLISILPPEVGKSSPEVGKSSPEVGKSSEVFTSPPAKERKL